ncbi:MAG: tetratricopeptide repeat protein, partial [Hyphomicrobiales bacterium]
MIAAVLAAIVVIGGGAAWYYVSQQQTVPALVEQTQKAEPDERSIAVLPFNNMSDDKNQVYFADGISEDIITDLSKVSGLFVVARNTSFQFRNGAMDLSEVGRKLGVRYILEGSVRRAGDQVRITAQLIDVNSNGHVWAERYDGSLSDVFAAQDKVTGQIIEALRVQLTPEEEKAVKDRGTTNPDAYDAYLQGLKLLSDRRRIDVESNNAAQDAFKKAIELDPDYAQAIAGLAWAKWLHVATINYFNDAPRKEAMKLAAKSLTLQDNALAHRILAREHFAMESEFLFTSRDAQKAKEQLQAAHSLQPNNPDVLADLAMVQSFSGEPKQALPNIRKAMELNQNHPDWYYGASGIALLLNGDFKGAAAHLRKWSDADTSWRVPYVFLASALGRIGEVEAAKAAIKKHGDMYGPGTLTTLRGVQHKWPMQDAEKEIFQKGLKLAGVK